MPLPTCHYSRRRLRVRVRVRVGVRVRLRADLAREEFVEQHSESEDVHRSRVGLGEEVDSYSLLTTHYSLLATYYLARKELRRHLLLTTYYLLLLIADVGA